MSQIIKKFIGNNQVGANQIRLENNSALKARNAADDANVDLIKLDAGNDVVLRGVAGRNMILEAAQSLRLPVDSSDPNSNLLTGAIYYNTNANELRLYDSSNWVTISGGGGADTDLGNLTPTAINEDLIPALDNDINLGSSSLRWAEVHTLEVRNDGASSALILKSDTAISIQDQAMAAAIPVRFYDEDNSNYISLRAPDTVSSNVQFQLPATDGSAGDVLQTNGFGVLSFGPASGTVVSEKETFTLSSGDITNQYIDLSNVAATDSIQFLIKGSGVMLEGASHAYSVDYTGGNGGNTRITFLNEIATGGSAALVAGDVVQVAYIVD
jgi:hypothetical protein